MCEALYLQYSLLYTEQRAEYVFITETAKFINDILDQYTEQNSGGYARYFVFFDVFIDFITSLQKRTRKYTIKKFLGSAAETYEE